MVMKNCDSIVYKGMYVCMIPYLKRYAFQDYRKLSVIVNGMSMEIRNQ